ncbi:hypothetical protein MY11210_004503 [Beauveria gryllotalpidicola]
MIFAADSYGLEPLEKTTLSLPDTDYFSSKEMDGFSLEELATVTLPPLAPFLAGLAAKYLSTGEDMIMIAVENLVDGMHLDESWVQDQQQDCEPAARELILQQVASKTSRMDCFSENKVTCFVCKKAEVAHIKSIAGFA